MNKKMIGALLGTLAMGTMNLAMAADEKPADAPKAEKKAKKGDKKKEGGEKSCGGDKKGGEKACGGEKSK